MKLKRMRVTNFRSVEDSDEFDITDLTCLVGKNEAGKSALLDALYGLNPIEKYTYDKVIDYPRRHYTDYEKRHPSGKSAVATTVWELEEQDLAAVEKECGEGCLSSKEITIQNGFEYAKPEVIVSIDGAKILASAAKLGNCSPDERHLFAKESSIEAAITKIEAIDEPSGSIKKTLEFLLKVRNPQAVLADLLLKRAPKFFLTSHYDRMEGKVAVKDLKAKQDGNGLTAGERIFLDFLHYAGTSLDELINSNRLEEETAKCEAASASITDEIFTYWTQNESLSVVIRINAAKQGDPPPFNEGPIVNLRIDNSVHRATIPLSERSAGFVWFFSFLAQFKMLKQRYKGPVILLLDEPGLTLHGKAQADLVRYIQERLLANHQVIYTTHSPFMVPAQHLDQVRVVEDKLEHLEGQRRPTIHGTKVSAEVLRVSKDTLFPLRGHLGYDISQSLFIAKNTLLVEGPSDILYLQVASEVLQSSNRQGLNPHWAICPSGGIDKLIPFVSLFSGNNLNIVTLSDLAHGDKGKIQRLRESEILEADQVLTTTDFTGKAESDVEDFFDAALFAELLNLSYGLQGDDCVTPEKLEIAANTPRLVKQAEALFRSMSLQVADFDHFTPARHLLQNPSILASGGEAATNTLDRFERAFVKINSFLSK